MSASITYLLADWQWSVSSGSASSTGNAESYFRHVGVGSYTREYSDEAIAWTIDGQISQVGWQRDASEQYTQSSYDGLAWLTTGSGSGRGGKLFFRSAWGSGSFTRQMTDSDAGISGELTGTRWESDRTEDGQQYETTLQLPVGGAW